MANTFRTCPAKQNETIETIETTSAKGRIQECTPKSRPNAAYDYQTCRTSAWSTFEDMLSVIVQKLHLKMVILEAVAFLVEARSLEFNQ